MPDFGIDGSICASGIGLSLARHTSTGNAAFTFSPRVRVHRYPHLVSLALAAVKGTWHRRELRGAKANVITATKIDRDIEVQTLRDHFVTRSINLEQKAPDSRRGKQPGTTVLLKGWRNGMRRQETGATGPSEDGPVQGQQKQFFAQICHKFCPLQVKVPN